MSFNNICVIGLGYIGLPTAAIFASKGMKVLGVDIDQTTIDTINQGKIHIIEPGLDKLVNSAVKSGHLRAAKTPESSDAFLIAVPTPFKKNKSECKKKNSETNIIIVIIKNIIPPPKKTFFLCFFNL